MFRLGALMLIAEMTNNTMMFLVATVVTTGLLLYRSHRQARRTRLRAAAPITAEALATRIKPSPAGGVKTPTTPEGWEVRMHDLTRDVVARLDSKITALQQLMIEAEEQTARLEALLAQADRQAAFPTLDPIKPVRANASAASPVSLPPARPAVPPSPQAQAAEDNQDFQLPPSPLDLSKAMAAPSFPRTAAPAVTTPAAAAVPHDLTSFDAISEPLIRLHRETPAPPSPGRRYDRIHALADEGLSAGEIAEQLGSPIGEVTLILSLRDKA